MKQMNAVNGEKRKGFMGKIKDNKKNIILGTAAFFLPMLILSVVFAFNGVHPFGDRQILVTDFWHQYYPFLSVLQEKIHTGGSLMYSNDIGMGINFWALIAYYCASPLNFLVGLVSKDALRDLVTLLVVLKVGFSGLFFSFYLKKLHRRYEYDTVVFSAIYALCGYMLGYYWNIMWLDCVALLPLVMLGVYSIVKENKFVLYAAALTVAVVSNFYIGFMVCLFTALYFFAECIKQRVDLKQFAKKLGIIAASSAVALAMTAFMTIPAYMSLQNTVSTIPKNTSAENAGIAEKVMDGISDGAKEFVKDAPDILGRLASFNEPVPKDGLPNAFSGFISVIMLGYFLASKKISKREKIVTTALIFVMFASMAVSSIDIVWHGMHKPNMVPYRYAFIFSFVMIAMAYRTFLCTVAEETETKSTKMNKAGFAIAAVLAAAVIFCAYKEAVLATVLGCAALAIVYFVIIQSFEVEKSTAMKKKWAATLCGFILAEVIINTVIAVPTVRTTSYSGYYYRGEDIEKLVEKTGANLSNGRVEISQNYTLNDPALYGYKGVSTFTSTANASVSSFLEKMAICGIPRSNRYYYETTSPLTNAFLGIERVIFKNDMKNLNSYLVYEAEENNETGKKTVMYKNTQSLPLGFMVNDAILAEEGLTGSNAFEIQNDLFTKATGLEDDLFELIPLSTPEGANGYTDGSIKVTGDGKTGRYTLKAAEDTSEQTLEFYFNIADDNPVYAYIDGKDVKSIVVSNTTYAAEKRKYIFPAGEYKAGDTAKFKFSMADSFKKETKINFYVYSLNAELFEEGMELLRDEPFEIEKREDTVTEGSVTAKNDGVLYTSIPYEEGWKAYVDGEETQITPLENAMIALNVKKGEHSIRLEYSPRGFKTGAVISAVSAAIFAMAAIVVLLRRKKNGQNIDSGALL